MPSAFVLHTTSESVHEIDVGTSTLWIQRTALLRHSPAETGFLFHVSLLLSYSPKGIGMASTLQSGRYSQVSDAAASEQAARARAMSSIILRASHEFPVSNPPTKLEGETMAIAIC